MTGLMPGKEQDFHSGENLLVQDLVRGAAKIRISSRLLSHNQAQGGGLRVAAGLREFPDRGGFVIADGIVPDGIVLQRRWPRRDGFGKSLGVEPGASRV